MGLLGYDDGFVVDQKENLTGLISCFSPRVKTEKIINLQKKPTAGSCSAEVFWYWTEVSLVNHSGLSSMDDSDAIENEDEVDAWRVFWVIR